MTRPASLRAGSKRSLALCIRKTPFWTPTITACWLSVALCTVCIYANVIRSLLTEWCVATGQIPDTQYGFYPGPDTQYGFYPGRNTFLPMFILRHLQHAAQTIKPNGSPRLHATFIDFKQAYDTIPRDALLWKHLRRTCMPAPLLSVIQDMYNRDEYVLKDGDKTACVHPTCGVKQGSPCPPCFFPFT